eukprot:CAMPEP_0172485210 /NCGR_PEP_ID=MMETSP1066-20121228/13127_1 /TAXON_ID=671091 /ORGANISM="Coscinodiscus wailesii, Strain CCMP2513" /LENGTH=234 /DNA_ID=CAMNT_0013250293 /DNA_START=209 /DNA_END=913 /DNA_ORIENTATION=+
MVSSEWAAMAKLVAQIYARHDAEPFREPVDWKSLALFDYPQIIKKPMDLAQVKRNIENGKYPTIHDAAEDVRLIWKNCMQYNADGSDFYVLAQQFSKRFEDKFAKLLKDQNHAAGGGGGGGGGKSGGDKSGKNSAEPTIEEKRLFAKMLYKITKEELGKVITELDDKCTVALKKNVSEDEVEINVDRISPPVFHEVMAFVKSCTGDVTQGSSGGGRKKKAAGSKPSSSKKSRTS